MRAFRPSRRQFIASTATAIALGPHAVRSAANERIRVGVIGCGKRSYNLLGQTLHQPDTQVVAVCEVEGARLAHAKAEVEKRYAAERKSGAFKGCAAYVDFRELFARETLDAVVIATPDHLHVHPALAAVRAKCDIYCEKPLTQNIAEGRLLADAVKKAGVVFQTGSQQRSEFANRFRTAVELIWAGRIGKVRTVRVGVGAPPKPCDLPTQETPENLAWKLWLGPAPWRGYHEALCPKGLHNHFPAFRNYEEYAGGGLADMGAHHFDIAQWALEMDHSGPVSIEPPAEGESGLKLTYASGVEMFHGGRSGCTFEGSEGTIYVDRGVLSSEPAGILEAPLSATDRRVQPSSHHIRNWLDAVKSRQDPICTAETGHRTATVCHLANLGYKLRRKLTWDPAKEEFENDAEANALRTREAREGWAYPA